AVENAGRAVAGHVDIGPAVIVVVQSGNAERVVAGGPVNVRLGADVFESAIAAIMVENIFRPLQATGAAHHGHTLPQAGRPVAGLRRVGQVEIHIVGDHQVELAVSVVIHECATRAPGFARAGHAGFFRQFAKGAVIVVIEAVFAVIGDIQIFPAIIIVIPHAHALPPAGSSSQPRLHRHVGESSVVIVAVKMVGWSFSRGKAGEGGAVDDEDVGPAIVVVVEDGDAGAGGLDDVLLGLQAAEDVLHGQSRLFGEVGKPCDARRLGCVLWFG